MIQEFGGFSLKFQLKLKTEQRFIISAKFSLLSNLRVRAFLVYVMYSVYGGLDWLVDVITLVLLGLIDLPKENLLNSNV